MNSKFKITIIIIIVLSLLTVSVCASSNPKDMTNAGYRMAPLLDKLSTIGNTEIDNSLIKFSDMEHWSKSYVGSLAAIDIIQGYPDGTFIPDGNINVDEFITLAVKSTGYILSIGNDYWAQPFIDIAKKDGLISEGEFNTYNRPILREEMVRILVKMVSMYEAMPTINEEMDDRVRCDVLDYDSVSDISKQSVLTAYRMGLMIGNPDGTFTPNSNLTRAEATTVLLRAIDRNRRTAYVPRTDRGIILQNPYSLKNYMIRPRGVPKECIEASYFLREEVKKTKGYSMEGTSGIFANTGFDIAESKEYWDSALVDIAFSITCQVTERMIPVENGWPLYEIGVWSKERFKRNNNPEILKAFLDFMFEDEEYKAKELVQKYIDMPWKQWEIGEGVFDETIINGRYVRIKTGEGLANGFAIIIGTKGF